MMLLPTRSWAPVPRAEPRAWRALRRGALALALAGAPAATLPAQPASGRTPRALSLEEAVRVADRQSESVRLAEAGVLRARGQYYQARSQALPQLNATGAYQKQLQTQFDAIADAAPAPDPNAPPAPVSLCTPNNIAPTATPEQRAAALAQARSCPEAGGGFGSITRIFANPNTIVLGITGSQPVFSGGRVSAGLRAAQAGRRSADIGVRSARAQVTLDVAQAYFDAVLTDRLVSISESSFVQTERAFRQTAIGREVGNVSEFDLLRARVSRDNQRPVLIQTRSQRDVAYVRLRQLLDLPLDEPLTLTTPLPTPAELAPSQLAAGPPVRPSAPGAAQVTPASNAPRFTTVNFDPAEVLGEDPDVRVAVDSVVASADTAAVGRAPTRQTRELVTIQQNLLRVARAQRLPSVSLSTNYQRFAYPSGNGITVPSALNQFFPNWTVSLGVSLPLLTSGRIRGDELVAEANLREAQQSARQIEELAALDARVAVSQLAQAEATWRASAGTSGQATRAYSIAEVRFREGIATQVELSDARLLLQQAEANAATAARDREVARLRLALLKDLPLSAGGAGGGASQGTAGQGGTAPQRSQQQSRQPQATGGAQSAGGGQQSGTFGGGTP